MKKKEEKKRNTHFCTEQISRHMETDFPGKNFSVIKYGTKKHNSYLIVFFTLILVSCNAPKSLTATSVIPDCLQEKIKKMSADISEGAPVSITQFTYHGQKVYYMIAPCCDKFNIVFDSVCTVLGYPDGGFAGRGDGKMPDFAKEAVEPKVIWEAKKEVK